MSCTPTKDVIKFGITELRKDGKIDTTSEDSLHDFVDDITLTDFEEVAYATFDQVNSVNLTFDDEARTATTTTSSELITLTTGLSDIKVKALKLKGDAETVSWLISKDGTNFFSVDSYDINENISSTEALYVKMDTSDTIVITGLIVIYENNS